MTTKELDDQLANLVGQHGISSVLSAVCSTCTKNAEKLRTGTDEDAWRRWASLARVLENLKETI